MKRAVKKGGAGGNKFSGLLAADKKKVVMAGCLVLVMAFMWVRMFSKKGPASTAAAVPAQQSQAGASAGSSELRISFVELPQVEGRHDVLTRDFFAAAGTDLDGTEETNILLDDSSEKYVRKVAASLKLKAIVLGRNPQPFINGKLLAVGDKLVIDDGDGTYECEVVRIEEKMVLMRYGEAEIQLKLSDVTETAH